MLGRKKKYLTEKFVEEYVRYQARTGMFLPRVRKPQ
jgi:protein-S-isoprenylcysteine O-methyltransferase Ste14